MIAALENARVAVLSRGFASAAAVGLSTPPAPETEMTLGVVAVAVAVMEVARVSEAEVVPTARFDAAALDVLAEDTETDEGAAEDAGVEEGAAEPDEPSQIENS